MIYFLLWQRNTIIVISQSVHKLVFQEGCEQLRQGGILHGPVPLRGDDRAADQRAHAARGRPGASLLLHAAVGETGESAGKCCSGEILNSCQIAKCLKSHDDLLTSVFIVMALGKS